MGNGRDRGIWRVMAAAAVLAASVGFVHAEESALLAPGVAAYQAGKTDQAIKALSGVLTNKSASGTDLARAYYYRGLAYAKGQKPAQAIADLNNALWLKGLAPEERANALLTRGKAYKATGLEQRAAQDFRDAEQIAPGAASAELAAVQTAAAPVATDAVAADAAVTETAASATESTGAALVLSPSTVQTTAKAGNKKATSTATVGGSAATSTQAAANETATLRDRGGTASRSGSTEALSTATVPSGGGGISSIFSGGDLFSGIFGSGSSSEPQTTETTSAPAVEQAAPRRKLSGARGESADFSVAAAPVTAPEPAVETVVASAAPATDAPLVLGQATTDAAPVDPATAGFAAEVEPQVSSWSSTVGEENVSFAGAGEPAAPAATGSEANGTNVVSSVSSFFEGLFDTNTSGDATGSTTVAPAAPTPIEAEVAAVEPAVLASVEAAAPAGRYTAQIATVRSPEEAEAIARRMRTERGALLGKLQTDVSPVVLGSMGTFYVVRVGPFADERASERFCGKLQQEGVDCFASEL